MKLTPPPPLLLPPPFQVKCVNANGHVEYRVCKSNGTAKDKDKEQPATPQKGTANNSENKPPNNTGTPKVVELGNKSKDSAASATSEGSPKKGSSSSSSSAAHPGGDKANVILLGSGTSAAAAATDPKPADPAPQPAASEEPAPAKPTNYVKLTYKPSEEDLAHTSRATHRPAAAVTSASVSVAASVATVTTTPVTAVAGNSEQEVPHPVVLAEAPSVLDDGCDTTFSLDPMTGLLMGSDGNVLNGAAALRPPQHAAAVPLEQVPGPAASGGLEVVSVAPGNLGDATALQARRPELSTVSLAAKTQLTPFGGPPTLNCEQPLTPSEITGVAGGLRTQQGEPSQEVGLGLVNECMILPKNVKISPCFKTHPLFSLFQPRPRSCRPWTAFSP